MTKIQTVIEGNKQIEGYVLLFSVGLLTALQKEVLEINTAEKYLFNPYSISELQKCNVDERILEFIERSLELDDLNDLLPEKYPEKLNELQDEFLQLISQVPYNSFRIDKLIDEVTFEHDVLQQIDNSPQQVSNEGTALEIDFSRVTSKYSKETINKLKGKKSPLYKIG